MWLASLFTFFSVMIVTSIDEVARELENPFRNIPNELPLVTYQAEFNEALLTMYSGFHPDSFWDPPLEKNKSHPTSDVDNQHFSSSVKQISTTMPPITENSARYEDEDTVGEEVADFNHKSGDQERMKAQLCLIVEQQGRMMEHMMTEQKRLNKMMEEMLSQSTSFQGK